MAPGTVLVPGKLPVLYDNDRVYRTRTRAVFGMDDSGRYPGHPVRDAIHGVSRHPGRAARAAADGAVAGAVRLPWGAARPGGDVLYLRSVQRGRFGAYLRRAQRPLRVERD